MMTAWMHQIDFSQHLYLLRVVLLFVVFAASAAVAGAMEAVTGGRWFGHRSQG